MSRPEDRKDIIEKGPNLDSLANFLTEGCIRIAGDDVDREKAQEILRAEGWKKCLEYMTTCFDSILATHTAFSWHYEPDEGVEEDRVNGKYDYLRATSKLGVKLESRGLFDLSQREAIKAIREGLNEVNRGFLYSNYSVHETAIASLQFLAERVQDPETLAQIQATLQKDEVKLRIVGSNKDKATHYDR